MCGIAAARLNRSSQIVDSFAHIGRGVLQHAWDQTDHIRRLHGEESGGRATEVVETHGLSELLDNLPTDNVIDAAGAKRASLKRRPESVVLAAAEQTGP